MSAQFQSRIDGAVHKLLDTQMERAERLVREHQAAVQAIADALLEHDVVVAADVHALAEAHGVPLPPHLSTRPSAADHLSETLATA